MLFARLTEEPSMAFERIRTIKGNDYRYLEERWREDGKVKSRSTYLGAVDAFLKNLVRKKDRRENLPETEDEASARLAREDAQRAKDERVSELLTAPTISPGGIAEISEKQASEAAPSPAEPSQPSEQSASDAGE